MFTPHPERGAVLAELHLRPFVAYGPPHRFQHFAFTIEPALIGREREAFARLCQALGVAPPAADARFHLVRIGGWSLRWELHTEFVNYTWATSDIDGNAMPAGSFAASRRPLPAAFKEHAPVGALLVAIDMALVASPVARGDLTTLFDVASLSVIKAAQGGALIATDFRADDNGFVPILVAGAGELSPTRAGRLVQRVIELETYRCLALLGLPLARKTDPLVRHIEAELLRMSSALAGARATAANRRLLDDLTALSAKLEAEIASTAFRFSATRAYAELVRARIEVLREEEHEGYISFSRMLRRRFNPAIATCAAIEQRQQSLSSRLAKTVDLLRTRIQSELEDQNRQLLASMNRRSRMQLRLQQTVEGLSIAAVTYYVVGLVGYVAKGLHDAHLLPKALSVGVISALAVPLIVIGTWALLHRARKTWAKSGDDDADDDHG